MVTPINPNDPFNPLLSDPELNRPTRFEDDFERDPALAEERSGGGRIAMFALATAVVLGAMFYGLSNGAMTPGAATKTATAPITQDSAQNRPPIAPGVRDVTPTNSAPGTTTGAAPARPQQQVVPPVDKVDRSNKGDAN